MRKFVLMVDIMICRKSCIQKETQDYFLRVIFRPQFKWCKKCGFLEKTKHTTEFIGEPARDYFIPEIPKNLK